MKLGKLLEGENFRLSDPNLLNLEVDNWTDRSHEVRKGSWFIAVKGETVDGHEFVQDAIHRGASGIIVERQLDYAAVSVPSIVVPNTRRLVSVFSSRWFRVPSSRLHLIGVTGTNGKTTTTFIIQHLFNSFAPAGVIGTVEARWSGKHIATANTTPGPRELNSILSQMADDGVKNCAMEVSSHALKQGRVTEVNFRTAVFTNLTQDHLDYHKTFEDYFESKAKLFLEFPGVERKIINIDDEYGMRLWDRIPGKSKVSYSVKKKADYQASDIQPGLDRTRFDLEIRGKKYAITTRLLCLHNVYNLIAAIAVSVEAGYAPEKIIESVRTFEGVPGRLDRIELPNGATVFVDYAHTPDAFLNIYSSLAPLKKGKMISVFGCGGNRDRDKRPKMGRIALQFSDFIIITSDNPREENPDEIIREIVAGIDSGKLKEKSVLIPDRREAIRKACEASRNGDLVLVLGKGHEDYQIIGKQKIHFSDQEEIKEWVRLRRIAQNSKNLLGV